MLDKKEIYLDHAATTYLRKEVLDSMMNLYEKVYGNPSSMHTEGLKSKKILIKAREIVSNCLNCSTKEIIFTGSGTESINLAIKGLAYKMKEKGKNHIITTTIEHHAVLHTCEYLEKKGFNITYLKVNKEGFINLEELKNAITNKTFLVTIIYANNEIGTIQDIKEIGKICKENKVLFHTDACQAAGSLNTNTEELGVDLMTINSSKLYGPKGVGALFVKKNIQLEPLIHGGGQERNLRSGTENVPGIAGFANALNLAYYEKEVESKRLSMLRDKLIDNILKKIPNTVLNGPRGDKRLSNNVNISFLDIEGEAILLYLNEKGIYASSGSACTSDALDPSHVIVATGKQYEVAHGSIRFTLGKRTTQENIDYLIEVLPEIIENLRKISPFKTEEIIVNK